MTLITINPLESDLWHNLITDNKTTVFHSTEWISVIAESYSWTPQADILLDESNKPIAGIAYFIVHDFRGPRIISLPFTDFCDPIAQSAEDWKRVTEKLLTHNLSIKMRCLHNEFPASDDNFKQINQAMWHRIDVSRDEDTIWSDISSSARRAIRKAEKKNVTVEFRNDLAAMKSFYNLHVGVRKYKHGLLAQPYEFFEQLAEVFLKNDKGTVALSYYDGEIVGSTLYLKWQDTLYYKYSASALTELAVRPTDILIYESIKYAKQQGFKYIDLGLSEVEHEGLVRFKRKYATDEKKVVFYGHKTDVRYPDTIQNVNQLFGKLTDILTDESVPDDVTARVGNIMYRFFI